MLYAALNLKNIVIIGKLRHYTNALPRIKKY